MRKAVATATSAEHSSSEVRELYIRRSFSSLQLPFVVMESFATLSFESDGASIQAFPIIRSPEGYSRFLQAHYNTPRFPVSGAKKLKKTPARIDF